MPMYIALLSFSDQGIRGIKEVQARQEAAVARAEAMGVRVKSVYMTMGEYDGVAIVEAPNDEAAVASAISAAMDGTVRTKTLRAFTLDEFAGIVGQLP